METQNIVVELWQTSSLKFSHEVIGKYDDKDLDLIAQDVLSYLDSWRGIDISKFDTDHVKRLLDSNVWFSLTINPHYFKLHIY